MNNAIAVSLKVRAVWAWRNGCLPAARLGGKARIGSESSFLALQKGFRYASHGSTLPSEYLIEIKNFCDP